MKELARRRDGVLRMRQWTLAVIFVGIAAGAALLCEFRASKSVAAVAIPYPHDIAQVSFAVTGDVIPHDAVRAAAAAAGGGEPGWAALFSSVADVFEGADFGFVNLETPTAPEHSRGTKPFVFNGPVALPEALKASGIKIVSFANNHVMDQGWAGFEESLQHLKQSGLVFAGTSDNAATAWQPVITEAHGIKVGWLGMTRWLNGNRNPEAADQPHVNFYPYPGESNGAPGADEAAVLGAVKAARLQCDMLVVSVHWGIEYAPLPRPEDVDLAHKIMEAGATVILGAHPHVLQTIETYRTQDGRNTVIFYSLGNFLSNQSRSYVDGRDPGSSGDPRDEMIGLFSATKRDYGLTGVRVELGNVGILPVWEDNNRNELVMRLESKPVIKPVLIDREIPKLEARLNELKRAAGLSTTNAAPVGASNAGAVAGANAAASSQMNSLTVDEKREFIAVSKRLKLLMDRRAQILARVGDDYVMAPPKLPKKP